MRNKLFSFMLLICVLTVTLYGCKTKEKLESVCFKEASEVRKNFFINQIDDLVLTFSSGIREENYNLDAIHNGDNIEFGLLTLYSKSKKFLDEQNSEFSLTIAGKVIEGEFEKNPFDGSLVYDIGMQVEVDKIDVRVKLNEDEYNFELKDEAKNWQVNHYDALTIACFNNKKLINNYIKNDKFEGEIYIKVSYNFSVNLNGEWYIKFLMKNKTIHVLVDKNDGSIISNIIE